MKLNLIVFLLLFASPSFAGKGNPNNKCSKGFKRLSKKKATKIQERKKSKLDVDITVKKFYQDIDNKKKR